LSESDIGLGNDVMEQLYILFYFDICYCGLSEVGYGYLSVCGKFLGHMGQMWMVRTINYSKVFVFRVVENKVRS
jgi:hypothetical protein